ncbi:MAG: hypothetical protein ABIQ74_10835 [Chitinophagales bacterium]
MKLSAFKWKTKGFIIIFLVMNYHLIYCQMVDNKNNSIGLGTNYFPLFFLQHQGTIDNYGIMLTYDHYFTRKLGTNLCLLYNSSLDQLRNGEPNGKFYGISTGIFYQFITLKRWSFRIENDILYQYSTNMTIDSNDVFKTLGQRIQFGPALGFYYNLSSFISFGTETGFTLGNEYFNNYLNNHLISSQNCYCFYFSKILSLQILYKF